jgi:hypothetical protein
MHDMTPIGQYLSVCTVHDMTPIGQYLSVYMIPEGNAFQCAWYYVHKVMNYYYVYKNISLEYMSCFIFQIKFFS